MKLTQTIGPTLGGQKPKERKDRYAKLNRGRLRRFIYIKD